MASVKIILIPFRGGGGGGVIIYAWGAMLILRGDMTFKR